LGTGSDDFSSSDDSDIVIIWEDLPITGWHLCQGRFIAVNLGTQMSIRWTVVGLRRDPGLLK
jgi:hypothetical protein